MNKYFKFKPQNIIDDYNFNYTIILLRSLLRINLKLRNKFNYLDIKDFNKIILVLY